MVSSNWDRVSLGDVCRVEAGAGFPIVHQGLKDQEFPFFKVGDMNTAGNEKEMHVFQHSISEEIRKKLRATAFPVGTIVFPKIGAAIATNKKRMIVKPSCVDNNVMALIPSENLDSSFLFYLLLNKDLSDFANTGNPPSIRQSNVEEWAIPLPPLTEQKRIASLLARADRLRSLRRTAHDLGESLLQSVFLEMFGDGSKFDKVEFEEILEESPKNGLYLSSDQYGSGTPIIRIDAFYDGVLGNPAFFKRLRATPKQIEEFNVQNDEILINRVNSLEYLGKCALVKGLLETTLFESNMMRIRINRKLANPVYVTKYLTTPEAYAQIMQKAKKAVNQASINQQDVKSIVIPVPPLSLQEEFAPSAALRGCFATGVVARVESLRGRMSESERQVNGLFESLLAEAFEQ